MTEEDKAKIAVATAAAKAKAKEIVSRENIDKVKDSVKNGVESLKTAEGRQRLKKSVIAGTTAAKNKVVETWKSGPKGKAICIGAVVALLVLGSMMGDDEDFASGRLGDEDDIMLSEKGFSSIFMNVGSPAVDDGMIYRHQEDISVKVLQATNDGLLVGYVTGSNPFTSGIENFVEKFGGSYDRIVFVTTDRGGYEDGQPLRDGYYVRNGTVSYVGVDGGEHTVAHYVEITREKEVAKIERAITKRKKGKEAARLKMEEAQLKECAKTFTPKWFDKAFKVLISDRVVVQKSEQKGIGTMNCPEFEKVREIAATGDWRKFKDVIQQKVKLITAGGVCDTETAAGCLTNITRGLQNVNVQLRGLSRGYEVSFSNLDLKNCARMSSPFNPERHLDPDLEADNLLFVFEVDPCGEFPEMVNSEKNRIVISWYPYGRKTFIARLGVLKKFCKEHAAEIREMRRGGAVKNVEKALSSFLDAN